MSPAPFIYAVGWLWFTKKVTDLLSYPAIVKAKRTHNNPEDDSSLLATLLCVERTRERKQNEVGPVPPPRPQLLPTIPVAPQYSEPKQTCGMA